MQPYIPFLMLLGLAIIIAASMIVGSHFLGPRRPTDIKERPLINPRRIAYFGDNRPASTLVEVKGLVDPRMKVEIECQAYVG